MSIFGISRTAINTAVKHGLFVKKVLPYRFSESEKLLLSEKRKTFLKNNPDKHPWKSKNKFKSVPCEKIKTILKSKNLSFIEEYSPIEDRFFSIDVAFPDKMIGIEVNGQQHYESNGKLKKYYQDRHDLLENNGWKIYEIHYSIVFNEELITSMIDSIISSDKKVEFNYNTYIKKEKKIYLCEKCKSKVCDKNISLCHKCSCESKRKVKRPTKEELRVLILNNPFTSIGEMFGVSDNAVRKWAKYYELPQTSKQKKTLNDDLTKQNPAV